MIKGHILITLNNGENIKYVRDAVTDGCGVNCKYYAYSGNCTNCGTYACQNTAGKIAFDYACMVNSLGFTYCATAPAEKLFKFPETTATCVLVRKSNDNSADKCAYNRITIPGAAIANIKVVEMDYDTDKMVYGV